MPALSPQNIVKLEVKAVIPHKKKNIFEDESALLVKKNTISRFLFQAHHTVVAGRRHEVKMKRRRNGRRGLVEGGGQWEPNGVETFLSWHLRNLPRIIIIVVESSKAHHKNAKLSC